METHSWKQFLLRPIYLLALLIIFCLPTLYIFQSYFSRHQELGELQESFQLLKPKLIKALMNRNHRTGFNERFQNVDHLYCENQLEKLEFQTNATQLTQQIKQYFSLNDKSTSQAQNRIRLREQTHRREKSIDETELALMQPISISTQDLYNLLPCIETSDQLHKPPTGSPQLTIKRFNLKKQQANDAPNCYRINFELIKREPIKS